MGEISVKTGNNARNGGKNSLNRLIRCVCGKKLAQIREILISESTWEEMTCLFAPSLMNIFKKLRVPLANVKDSTYIKASTLLQETRTGELNRGKGLNDIKSVIDSIGDGFMGIFSSKGRYIYKGKTGIINEVLRDYKSSVNGTIIEWTIPCEVETE
ncbi:hypothetical protein MZH69_16105 [Escherichia coli]|nr:hypothetical protein MZH69_16105 [Escherichia coli]